LSEQKVNNISQSLLFGHVDTSKSFLVVATSSSKFEFFTLTIFVYKYFFKNMHYFVTRLVTDLENHIRIFFCVFFFRVKLCNLVTRFLGVCFAHFCKNLSLITHI
jgi:hypothetical protein